MTELYPLCGHCLHATSTHEKHNGKFMYCGVCFTLCEIEDFEKINQPTSFEKTIKIGAKKQ